MPTLDSVTIEVLNTLDQISIDPVESTSIIQLEENSPNLVVELSTVDPASLVKSVNGRTGNVVINYSDIAGAPDWATTNGSSNAAPVNQVRFVYTQNAPANQWTINHNLGFFPNITVLDNQNRLLEVHIEYLNTNTARIVMNSACSGVAYLT
jgi:hypothetical protein